MSDEKPVDKMNNNSDGDDLKAATRRRSSDGSDMSEEKRKLAKAKSRGRKASIAGMAITSAVDAGKSIGRRLSSFGLMGGIQLNFEISPEEIDRLNENRGSKEVLKELGGLSAIMTKLCGSFETGITDEATGVLLRQQRFGKNQYKEVPPKSLWSLLAEQFEDQVLQLLMFAALLSTILGVAIEEQRKERAWIDGVAIWMAVIAVSLLGAVNNYQKERQFRNINQQRDAIDVTVFRSGKEMTVPSYQIVVGDIMLIDTGDKVVADGLIISCNELILDEASLTGESEPMKKDTMKEPFVWTGTQVSEGSGKFLVTAVGERSEWGKTMAMIMGDSEETPLQEKLGELAILIGKIGTVVAIMCFIILVISHFVDEGSMSVGDHVLEVLDFFMFAVTIIVVAVPEGLPLAVTISLAYSMMKMMKDNNFVRVLEACETMGGATAICSDKTGTLTENRMTVIECWMNGEHHKSVPEAASLESTFKEALSSNISINSKAHLVVRAGLSDEFIGNRTECALLTMIKNWGIDYHPIRKTADVVKLIQFTSDRKMSSAVVRKPSGELTLYSKGAAEIVLGKCKNVLTKGGVTSSLDQDLRTDLEGVIDQLASKGLRTLCVAFRTVDPSENVEGGDVEKDLTLLTIVGIKDPLRKETAGAVAQCKSAGITVRMVTGDNLKTARHIGRDCGIYFDDGICMEGQEFRNMSEEELIPILPRLQVLARSTPSDKLMLVRLLKKLGEVVAVTGDGTNDAPALKESNVGLSMGKTGTEVAKEASDIVILDDNFNSIVKSVLWGRSIFRNIRKFLQFQVTINLVALALSFVACIAQKGMPLTVLQLLWVNLIMDSMAALALATEMPTPDLLLDKPHGREEPLVNNNMLKHVVVQGTYQLVVLVFILFALQEMHDVAPQYKLPDKCTADAVHIFTPDGFTGFNTACVGQTTWLPACQDINAQIQSYVVPTVCNIIKPVNSTESGYTVPEYTVLDTLYTHQKKEYDHEKEKAELQLYSFLFNTFIFMQVFNEINARKIANEFNVFEGFFDSPIFASVLIFTLVIQVVIMETSVADFFELTSLSWEEWVGSIGIGIASLPIALATKVVIRLLDSKNGGSNRKVVPANDESGKGV